MTIASTVDHQLGLDLSLVVHIHLQVDPVNQALGDGSPRWRCGWPVAQGIGDGVHLFDAAPRQGPDQGWNTGLRGEGHGDQALALLNAGIDQVTHLGLHPFT